jgi:hypothetical protein
VYLVTHITNPNAIEAILSPNAGSLGAGR